MIFLFLCHHSKYSWGFLHTIELLTCGLGFYNTIMKFLFYVYKCKANVESKYAKVEIIHAMLKSKYR
jgi:hypothetical protein